MNDLFQGELSDEDQARVREQRHQGNLLESDVLGSRRRTPKNSSPTRPISRPSINAIMGALDAHTAMNAGAQFRSGAARHQRTILLDNAGPYEICATKAVAKARSADTVGLHVVTLASTRRCAR